MVRLCAVQHIRQLNCHYIVDVVSSQGHKTEGWAEIISSLDGIIAIPSCGLVVGTFGKN